MIYAVKADWGNGDYTVVFVYGQNAETAREAALAFDSELKQARLSYHRVSIPFALELDHESPTELFDQIHHLVGIVNDETRSKRSKED